MAIEVKEITSLAGDAENWIHKIADWLDECEKSGETIPCSDVMYFTAYAYPRLWEQAIAPVWSDIREKLFFKDHGAFAILRTKSSDGGRTGIRKNQHILPVRTIGDQEGSIWDGEKWLKFETPKVFQCLEPALIKGNVEFLVISEKEV